MVREPKEGLFWQADHIVPVCEGGGETSDMDNFRTLCTACHDAESAKLAPSRFSLESTLPRTLHPHARLPWASLSDAVESPRGHVSPRPPPLERTARSLKAASKGAKDIRSFFGK